jgi:MFS family permease
MSDTKTGSEKTKFYYGWVVIACCCLLGTTVAALHTFGIYLTELAKEFGWSRATTSTVSSFSTVMYCISAVTVGWLTDRFGPKKVIWPCAFLLGGGLCLSSLVQNLWQLYLFYGVIAAFGIGIAYSLPTATVQRWFIEKRGLALGINMSGIGIGTLAVGLLLGYLIPAYGWRVAFLVEGILFFIILVISAIFIVGNPDQKGLAPYGKGENKTNPAAALEREWSLSEVLLNRSFWAIYGIHFFASVSLLIVMVHIVPHAEDMGISKLVAAGALGLLGGFSIIGRLAIGGLCDKIGFRNGIIFSLALCGAMFLYIIFVNTVWMLYLFVFIFALGYGGKASALPGLVGSVFGTKSLAMIMGLVATSYGVAGVFGPPLGGWIYDATGNYTIAFLAGVVSYGLGILLTFTVRPKSSASALPASDKPGCNRL